MKTLFSLAAAALVGAGCGHARPAPSTTPTYVISEDSRGVGSALGAGGSGHDCDEEMKTCFDNCWNAKKPPYPHKPNSEWYYEYCTRECRKVYMECAKEQEAAGKVKNRPPLKFLDVQTALAWLRSHKSEVAIGTVVIVGGTAFVVATGGAGALLLAPLAL